MAWERLASAGNPITDFPYASAWAAGLDGAQELSIFVADGEEPAAIAPLVVDRRSGRLTLLASEMCEILDFLYADRQAVIALAQAVVRAGRPLHLPRVPVDSPVVGAIEKAYHGAGIVVRQLAGGSPWIPLDPSWTEPEAHLNSKRRMTLRRARRLAEQMGPVTVEIVIPDSARLPALLDEAFRVEAAGWKGAKGSALAMDAERGAFFRRYAQDTCSRGILRICFLTIGGQTAAAQIAVDTGSQFSLLRTGYDERFSRCSPGMLLTHEGIRYAARRGLCSYEFNGTVEPWTEMWTHHERPSCSIRAYPFTWRGLSAFAADGLRSVPKKFRRITKVSM